MPRTATPISRVALLAALVAALLAAVVSPASAAPPYRIKINDVVVTEGDGGTVTATFAIGYTGKRANATVDYASADVDATAGADYTGISGTASLPKGGCKCATVTVEILGDVEDEINETFVLNLSNPSRGSLVDGQGVATIVDDDGVPSISVTDGSAPEPAGSMGFAVSLSNATVSPVSVDYMTSDVSASAPADYGVTSGTLTFAAGETTKFVDVTIVDDDLAEGNETLAIALSNSVGGSLFDAQAVGTIDDDEKLASSLTLGLAAKKGKAIVARGVLEPADVDSRVRLVLKKRTSGAWKRVATKTVTVVKVADRDLDGSSDARYRGRFGGLKPGRYQVRARYAGSPDVEAASSTARIRL